jgi:hypothetical protein
MDLDISHAISSLFVVIEFGIPVAFTWSSMVVPFQFPVSTTFILHRSCGSRHITCRIIRGEKS